jgi:hypothetical protein
MRKLVLMAIFCSGVLYAPMPLIAQNGGGPTPLIPVADMPADNGAATAPSDPPLEVDADKVPELIPPREVGGGAEAPSHAPSPAPAPAPEPAPAPTPAAEPEPEPIAHVAVPPRDAQPAQDEGEEPVGSVPDETPTTPEPEPDQDAQDDEEFEEEFDNLPEPGEPESRGVAPQATAGPQLPRTGADLPALLLSGLALMVSGMSLRALCRERS